MTEVTVTRQQKHPDRNTNEKHLRQRGYNTLEWDKAKAFERNKHKSSYLT